jgi:hypothetical protein
MSITTAPMKNNSIFRRKINSIDKFLMFILGVHGNCCMSTTDQTNINFKEVLGKKDGYLKQKARRTNCNHH